LLVLDPSQTSKITKLFSIVGEKLQGQKQVDQRLSADGFQPPEQNVPTALTVDQLLGPNLKAGLSNAGSASQSNADDMLLAAEKNFNRPDRFATPADGTLGTPQLIWDWITGVDKDEALRRALKDWLEKDKTFDMSDQDDTYKQVTAAVGPAIDFVITGHTHLERAIDMGGGRYYFNCGTWIRLLQFTNDMLKDTASFKEVYNVLINGRMEAIDNAKFGGKPFVLDRTSAVLIKEEKGKVIGCLNHIAGDGSGEPETQRKVERL